MNTQAYVNLYGIAVGRLAKFEQLQWEGEEQRILGSYLIC